MRSRLTYRSFKQEGIIKGICDLWKGFALTHHSKGIDFISKYQLFLYQGLTAHCILGMLPPLQSFASVNMFEMLKSIWPLCSIISEIVLIVPVWPRSLIVKVHIAARLQ